MVQESMLSNDPPAPEAAHSRFVALDGLRGIAALTVLICHCLLVTPTLSAAYGMGSGEVTGWEWLITYSPLHIFWAGTEAVYVFFVLSGFVLALAFTRERRPSWWGYYPRRLLRLYLPVWASVAFAVATFALVAHHSRPDLSGWVNLHDSDIDKTLVARDLSLMVRPGVYATPLWSLKWEVVFSLLLPLFLVAATFAARRWWPLTVALLLAAVAVGHIVNQFWLFYLPVFGIGVVMAAARADLGVLAQRLGRPRWIVLSVVALLFLTAQWTAGAFVGVRASEMWLPKVLGVAGAALCVFIFSSNVAAIRIGSSAPLQWLGKRSFSLYLVHEPIIVTVAFALSLHNGWVSLLISLPVSLLACAGFYILCEAPSHRLANQVGRCVDHFRRASA